MARSEYDILYRLLTDITKQNTDQLVRLARLEDTTLALQKRQEQQKIDFVPRSEIMDMAHIRDKEISAVKDSLQDIADKIDAGNKKKEKMDEKLDEIREKNLDRSITFRNSAYLVFLASALSILSGIAAQYIFHFFH